MKHTPATSSPMCPLRSNDSTPAGKSAHPFMLLPNCANADVFYRGCSSSASATTRDSTYPSTPSSPEGKYLNQGKGRGAPSGRIAGQTTRQSQFSLSVHVSHIPLHATWGDIAEAFQKIGPTARVYQKADTTWAHVHFYEPLHVEESMYASTLGLLRVCGQRVRVSRRKKGRHIQALLIPRSTELVKASVAEKFKDEDIFQMKRSSRNSRRKCTIEGRLPVRRLRSNSVDSLSSESTSTQSTTSATSSVSSRSSTSGVQTETSLGPGPLLRFDTEFQSSIWSVDSEQTSSESWKSSERTAQDTYNVDDDIWKSVSGNRASNPSSLFSFPILTIPQNGLS